jgi:hypothetical protein
MFTAITFSRDLAVCRCVDHAVAHPDQRGTGAGPLRPFIQGAGAAAYAYAGSHDGCSLPRKQSRLFRLADCR